MYDRYISTIRFVSVGPTRGSHFKVHLHPVLVEVGLSVAAVDATMLSSTPHPVLVEVGLSVAAVDATILSSTPLPVLVEVGFSVAAVDATMLSPTPPPSSSGGGAQCSGSGSQLITK